MIQVNLVPEPGWFDVRLEVLTDDQQAEYLRAFGSGTDLGLDRLQVLRVDPTKVRLVGGVLVTREWPHQRYRPIAPHGDGVGRLSRILAAITEPVDLNVIRGGREELTGQVFEPGQDWRESLFDHLVTNEYVFQTTQVLKRPQPAQRGVVANFSANRHESAAGGGRGQR